MKIMPVLKTPNMKAFEELQTEYLRKYGELPAEVAVSLSVWADFRQCFNPKPEMNPILFHYNNSLIRLIDG